jgi:hypothetical protein
MPLILHFAYLLYYLGMTGRLHSLDAATGPNAPNITELSAQCIEAIATRVIELLHEHTQHLQHPESLIDVAELARRTGLSRTWIYEHARDLGAIRLGDGPRARLRFNPDTVKRLLEGEPPRRPQPVPARRQRPISPMPNIELLPITSIQPPPPGPVFYHHRAR